MGREGFALVWLRFLVAFCACSHKCYYVMVLLLAGVYCHRNSWGFWSNAACSGESWSEQWEEKFLRGGFNLFNFSCGRTKLKTSGSLPEYIYCPLLFSLSFSSPRLRYRYQAPACRLHPASELGRHCPSPLIITIFILLFLCFFSFLLWTEAEVL